MNRRKLLFPPTAQHGRTDGRTDGVSLASQGKQHWPLQARSGGMHTPREAAPTPSSETVSTTLAPTEDNETEAADMPG